MYKSCEVQSTSQWFTCGPWHFISQWKQKLDMCSRDKYLPKPQPWVNPPPPDNLGSLGHGQQLHQISSKSKLLLESYGLDKWHVLWGHGHQLCEILSRSNMAVRSYGLDTDLGYVCNVSIELRDMTLTQGMHCDLDLWDVTLTQGHDTPFDNWQQLCEISRSNMAVRSDVQELNKSTTTTSTGKRLYFPLYSHIKW